MKYQPGI